MNNKTRKKSQSSSAAEPARRRRKGLEVTLLVIVGACLCLAWAHPLKKLMTRRVWPTPSSVPRDSYSFIAIAYTQPSLSPAGSKNSHYSDIYEHLDALVANGYTPITLNDVNLLLRRGHPLPRNAVLLTADIDSKTFLDDIRAAVWRYGWHGVAFVDTASLSVADGDSLNWSTIRKLDNTRNWETGLSGHLAPAGVPANNMYGSGQFLSSRMWMASAKRYETNAEFKKRVEEDYEISLQLARKHLSHDPISYAYPFGDFGQYAADDDIASDVNLAAAGEHFAMAFTLGAVGRNTMFTDPRRLNRMEINPSWSSSEFIEALQTANRPIEQVEDIDMTRWATGWYANSGQFKVDKFGLTLEAAPASGEGSVWLGGSDVRRDFSATVDFVLYDGVASFYARSAPDRSSYLLVEFDGDGNAVLKQKTALTETPFTLARSRAAVRTGKRHKLTFYLRDSNVNISIDGITIFNTHEQTTGVKRNGLFGAAVHTGSADRNAGLMITNLQFERRQSTLASWDFDPSLDPYAVSWIQSHGSRLTEISPPIQRLQEAGPYRSDLQQPHIFRRLSSLYRLRLMPCLQISSPEDLEKWSPVALAGTLSDLDCDGVYVNFEQYDQFNIKELEQWLRQTSKMLSGAGRPVLVRLPRMLERLSAVYSLLAVIPSVEVVTDADTKIGVSSLQARQIREESIATPTPDQLNSLPPVYTIDDAGTPSREQTIEDRIRELIDDGETAFRRGIYESAIAAFAEWQRLAPESAKPPRRIGDALTNLGYHDEAAGFYRQSLDINPAQIDLATHYARLLRELGRKVEARGLLNTYARLFPDSSDVLLAQAEWLYTENRTDEARKRAQRVLLLEPTNFDATLFMLRIAENEVERTTAIEKLMEISKTPEQQHQLITAIWQYDLLTYQNSHLFINSMDKIASETDDPRIQKMLARIEPLDETIIANFKTPTALEKHWQVEGASATIQEGALTVQADTARTELSVRLLRSERWRDSFIETTVDKVSGGFWLYARRSRDHLIRLGFDAGSDG
jgi:tetratricopeptide (TPR) repeat protein